MRRWPGLAVVCFGLAGAALLWWPLSADGFRYVGLGAELLGLLLIAVDIRERRREANEPSMADMIRDHIRRRRRPPQDHPLEGTTGVTMTVGADLDVRWRVDAPVKQRIEHLERRIANAERKTNQVESALAQEAKVRELGDEAERLARERLEFEVLDRLRRTEVGGLWRERAGVALFLIGLVFTNLPEELERWT